MRYVMFLMVVAALAGVACGGGGPGGTGGSAGHGGTGGSSTSMGATGGSTGGSTGGGPVTWDGGLLSTCLAVQLVGLGPQEDRALGVQRIDPVPPGARTVDEFTLSFPRLAGQSGGPFTALWAKGTPTDLDGATLVEKVFQETDLVWVQAGGIELASATVVIDPPLDLADGEVAYLGMRLEKHMSGAPSALALCAEASEPFTAGQTKGSLFSHSLPGGTVAQCPGDCSLDTLASFGSPYPLILSAHGH